jgi:hypothetical protein
MSAIWGKVYGSLHSSVKWQRATDAARALWTTALSWSVAQGTDGNLPRDILGMLGSRRRAAENLVEVGLWEVTEEGWRFHDWLGHNVSDQQIQEQREATRARVQKHRERQGNGVTAQGSNALHVTPRNTARTEQNREEKKDSSSEIADATPDTQTQEPRPDVEKICEHMADSIQARGVKRPFISKAWKTAARLMLDKDGYTLDQILWMIDWTEKDSFWASNILSVTKLRDKMDQLVIKVKTEREKKTNDPKHGTSSQAWGRGVPKDPYGLGEDTP